MTDKPKTSTDVKLILEMFYERQQHLSMGYLPTSPSKPSFDVDYFRAEEGPSDD